MQKRSVADDITDALFELLKTKKLANITTTEIIKKAGVCRSSFYRNFYLPEDVIRKYGNDLFDEIQRMTPVDRNGLREHIEMVNQCFFSHREQLTLLDQRGLIYLLERPIANHCFHQFQSLGVRDDRYRLAYFAGASSAMLRAWIHKGFQESPRELADITFELINRDLLKQ